ncbi:hypothetical protein L596_027499 [Steinernema carpocapsae]|uniref:G-protein coupled receptors family 1 profile domain-containing protein n=1 Tax=Steinernema carpocapsae TaxID=34508 RepID=A0A4V5ZXK8_STECR|nr:hypothetical protein L596_027499 [Steinernema carpocapsae]
MAFSSRISERSLWRLAFFEAAEFCEPPNRLLLLPPELPRIKQIKNSVVFIPGQERRIRGRSARDCPGESLRTSVSPWDISDLEIRFFNPCSPSCLCANFINPGVLVTRLDRSTRLQRFPAAMTKVVDRISTDYVQIVLYIVFVAVGLPVNISTFVYMLRRYRHARNPLLLLHINLNISDIMVNCPKHLLHRVYWLYLTYEWVASEFVCVTMRFMDHLVFQISSIVMVCIALYRLYALRYPMVVSTVGQARVFCLMGTAWLLAVLLSLPQMLIWKLVEVDGMTQCVTIWTEQIIRNQSAPESMVSDFPNSPKTFFQLHMKMYNVYHLMTVFYVPLTILIFCYVLIMSDVCRTLRQHEDPCSVTEVTKFSSQRYSVRILAPFPIRGQDRLRRAKIRSLRITLLLILAYVATWLPYNLLSWWLVISVEGYRQIEDLLYCLNCLVVLNSLINPLIYGRTGGFCFGIRKQHDRSKKRTPSSAGCCLFAAY